MNGITSTSMAREARGFTNKRYRCQFHGGQQLGTENRSFETGGQFVRRQLCLQGAERQLESFFGTGLTNQTSVALVGSNDKGHFRLGISNLYLNSNIPNSWMKQQGFNFNTTYNLTSKLSFTLTANYVFEDVQNRASFSDAPGNVIAPLLYLSTPSMSAGSKHGWMRITTNYCRTGQIFMMKIPTSLRIIFRTTPCATG